MDRRNAVLNCLLVATLLIAIQACKLHTQVDNDSPFPTLQPEKVEMEIDSFDLAIATLQKDHNVPGVSIAFIKEGKLHSTRTYGKLQEGEAELIDNETMFSVGSISKVVNAILILKLVDSGQLDLDTDVNQYLTDWKVEENRLTKGNPVTLRKILSHTAGFSVHGFADFSPGEPLPTTLQILNGEPPAKNEKVELIHDVGSKFKYSGGGITVAQKIVEDVTGLLYHDAAKKYLFDPFGLVRTSYENPLPEGWGNIAKAHSYSGEKEALPRGYQAMPESAASGLWTTPSELSKLLTSVYSSLSGQSNNFLSLQMAKLMTIKNEHGDYALGPDIKSYRGDKLMQHGGANDSYKALFCFYFEKGFGYIIFTNGAGGWDLIMDNLSFYEDKIRTI